LNSFPRVPRKIARRSPPPPAPGPLRAFRLPNVPPPSFAFPRRPAEMLADRRIPRMATGALFVRGPGLGPRPDRGRRGAGSPFPFFPDGPSRRPLKTGSKPSRFRVPWGRPPDSPPAAFDPTPPSRCGVPNLPRLPAVPVKVFFPCAPRGKTQPPGLRGAPLRPAPMGDHRGWLTAPARPRRRTSPALSTRARARPPAGPEPPLPDPGAWSFFLLPNFPLPFQFPGIDVPAKETWILFAPGTFPNVPPRILAVVAARGPGVPPPSCARVCPPDPAAARDEPKPAFRPVPKGPGSSSNAPLRTAAGFSFCFAFEPNPRCGNGPRQISGFETNRSYLAGAGPGRWWLGPMCGARGLFCRSRKAPPGFRRGRKEIETPGFT